MKKTRLGKILFLLLAATLLLTACGQDKKDDVDTSWTDIEERGVIVAGLDDNYPPMGYRDENGDLVGFDIEMGDEIAKRLGVDIEWQPAAWDGMIGALKAKKFDIIISGMTITPERAAEADFAGPYVHAAQAIVVKVDNETVKGLEDFKDKNIGTQSGSAGFKVCTELQEEGVITKEFKDYADYGLAFQDLKIGRVDALVADDYVINGFIKEMPGEFKVVGEKFEEETQGIAIRPGDKELFDKIDGILTELMDDGTLIKLSEKWLGGDAISPLLEK